MSASPLPRALRRASCTLAILQALPALAQSAAEPTVTAPADEPAVQRLAPIVITATRSARLTLDVPASVELLERDAIRDTQLRVNLSESLDRVPGIVVLNRQNYAQDLQISTRGFGARSTFGVRGVRLYVDGVPATFPDGQGQVSHFPLNAAERIEVLRGPFSALYGNSSGGVIALTTELKAQPPRFEPSAVYGSNNTWRVGFNGVGGEGGYAFAVDANRFHTDGQRDHSEARRDTFNLRTGFAETPIGNARISVNLLAMPDAQDALGLTRAQMQTDRDQAGTGALAFDTRKTTRQNTVGGDLSSDLGTISPGLTLTTTAWVGTRAVIQYQSIPVATQTPASSPGGVIDFDRTFGGADLRLGLERASWSLTGGVDVERLAEDRRGYNNFIGTGASQILGTLGALRRDETNTVTSVDPYLQGEVKLGDREAWRVLAGVRSSRVRVSSDDHYIVGTNGNDSGAVSFSGVSPTAGVVYKLTPRFSVYASYGRGFETPTLNELAYRADGTAGLNTTLSAAKSNNVEVGFKAAYADRLRYSFALFSIKTKDDLVVRTNQGGRSAFANVGATRRDGVEAGLDWTPLPALSLYASAAAIKARYDEAFFTCGPPPCATPNVPIAAGNKLPGVPAATGYLELKYRNPIADISLEGRVQSKLWVDDRNSDYAPGYGILNFAVARNISFGRNNLRLFARVDNLLDREYVGSVIVNEANGRYFEPAPGRTWLVGLDWRL